MPVVTWKSNCVFASGYFQESSAIQDYFRQFGPLIIAGDRLHRRPPTANASGCGRYTLHSPHPSLSSRPVCLFFLTDSSLLFLRAMVHIKSIVLPSPDSISAGVTFLFGHCSHIVQTYSLIGPCSH